jgi:hypothetical protein
MTTPSQANMDEENITKTWKGCYEVEGALKLTESRYQTARRASRVL